MRISQEQLHKKKRELGIETAGPTAGPLARGGDALRPEMQAEAAEAAQADLAKGVQFQQSAGTNDHNQYRYGGDRP